MTNQLQKSKDALVSFISHDYRTCADIVASLLPATILVNLEIMLVSLQRLGESVRYERLALQCVEKTPDYPWENAMLRMALGTTDLKAILPLANDETEVWLARFFAGCWFFADGKISLAREQFELCLPRATDPLIQRLVLSQLNAIALPLDDPSQRLGQLTIRFARLYRQGAYADALSAAQETVEIGRRLFPPNDPRLVQHLHALATVNNTLANEATALSLWYEAYFILQNAFGESDPGLTRSQMIYTLKAIANCERRKNNYYRAGKALREICDIQNAHTGKQHLDYAESIKELGELWHKTGDNKAAVPLLKEAADIERELLGESHSRYAMTLNALATAYAGLGREHLRTAIECCDSARTILLRAPATNDSRLALVLHNLAAIYELQGKHDKALPLLLEAAEMAKVQLGTTHKLYGQIQFTLSTLYFRTKAFSKGRTALSQATEILRNEDGNFLTHMLELAPSMAFVHINEGRPVEALRVLLDFVAINDDCLAQMFTATSERTRLEALRRVQRDADLLLALVFQALNEVPEAIISAFRVVLKRKALAREVFSFHTGGTGTEMNPHLREKVDELTLLRLQIAELEFDGPVLGLKKALESEDAQGRQVTASEMEGALQGNNEELKQVYLAAIQEEFSQLRRWQTRRDELEAEISGSVPWEHLRDRLRTLDPETLLSGLPKDSALIEFVRFSPVNFLESSFSGKSPELPDRYAAFVVRAGRVKELRLVDLGESSTLDEMIRRLRDDHNGRGSPGASTLGREAVQEGIGVRARLFDTLRPALEDCRRLIIAPDDWISAVSFATLPNDSGGFLIDEYVISYVTTGRDVERFGTTRVSPAGISVVVGDPDFDLGASRISGTQAPPLQGSDEVNCSGSPVDSLQRRSTGFAFPRLHGTRVEAERVSEILHTSAWIGPLAVKSRILGITSPLVLHISTHGYFLENKTYPLFDDLGHYFYISSEHVETNRLESLRVINPLLRSGLALAGVNAWLRRVSASSDAGNGILTGEDVTKLDLRGTELVVLSCCDSGLGQVRRGEGVSGLRQVFAIAGARTIVTSLWNVPDLATVLLMERFYENLLMRGMGRAEALRSAQLYVRDVTVAEFRDRWLTESIIAQLSSNDDLSERFLQYLAQLPDANQPFQQPIHWGGFVCHGEPVGVFRASRPGP